MDRRSLATSMRRPFRAIAMFFGSRRQGLEEARATLSSVKHPAATADRLRRLNNGKVCDAGVEESTPQSAAHDPHRHGDCAGGVHILVSVEPSKYFARNAEHPRFRTSHRVCGELLISVENQ